MFDMFPLFDVPSVCRRILEATYWNPDLLSLAVDKLKARRTKEAYRTLRGEKSDNLQIVVRSNSELSLDH